MLALTVMVVLAAAATEYGLLPAYDELAELRSRAQLRVMQYARLSRNLAVRNKVAEEFQRSASSSLWTGNDEVALSNFLRDLEAEARLPGLNIVNIKPLPVKNEKTHKVYSAKLTLAGRLAEVLKFGSEITGGQEVVGIESFNVRGTQKFYTVECALAVRKLSLIPKGTKTAHTLGQVLARKDDRRDGE
jgi:hypothetical protein